MKKLQEDKDSLFSPDHIFNSFAFLLGASQGSQTRSENRTEALFSSWRQTEGTFKDSSFKDPGWALSHKLAWCEDE